MQCEAFLKHFRPRSVVDYAKNKRVEFSQIFEFVDLSDSNQSSPPSCRMNRWLRNGLNPIETNMQDIGSNSNSSRASLSQQTIAPVETERFDQIEQSNQCAQAASTISTMSNSLPTGFSPIIVSQSQVIAPCQSYLK